MILISGGRNSAGSLTRDPATGDATLVFSASCSGVSAMIETVALDQAAVALGDRGNQPVGAEIDLAERPLDRIGHGLLLDAQLRQRRVRGSTGLANGRPSARARRYSCFSR